MRAISLSCPNCAAKLEAPETASTVRCSYCGTQARIQHRTRYLERKIVLPPPAPKERNLPVAKQKHRLRWILTLTSFLPLVLGGGIFYITMKRTGGLDKIGEALSNAKSAIQSAGSNESRWHFAGSGNVLLFDVNKDNAPDIIAPVRYLQQDDSYRIAAFDGLQGDRLWESEVFGVHADAIEGRIGLAGAFVVVADSRGNISGFAADNGGTLWKLSMGEKLKEMCQIDSTHLALELIDRKWKFLNLENGTLDALHSRPDECASVSEYREHGQAGVRFASDSRSRKAPTVDLEGMKIDDALEVDSVPGYTLLTGHKTPGTRVPMMALVREQEPQSKKRKRKIEHEVDWIAELPALDPLNVKEGAPELVAMDQNFIVAMYTPTDGNPHVVGFSREGGQRLWDRALPDHSTYVLRGLDINKARVYVSQWSRLDAFDLGDGSLVFSLGQ